MPIPDLPDDIIHLIIDQLRVTHEFGTLYNTALASKRLSIPAIAALYRYSFDSNPHTPNVFDNFPATRVNISRGNRLVGRYIDRFVAIAFSKPPPVVLLLKAPTQTVQLDADVGRIYEVAPITNRGRDESTQANLQPSQLAAKWAQLWRSITLSCGDTRPTAWPYASFLRVLDLGDLGYLFDDGQFTGKLLRSFFDDIASVVDGLGPTGAPHKRGWNQKQSVQRIGDLITQHSSLVEELDGNLDGDVLSTWIPRLQKLSRLRLWNGCALADCGNLLATQCSSFKTVEFYQWDEPGKARPADEEFAGFLSQLRDQTLESLWVIGHATFGPLTFSALSERHGESLTALVLNDLPTQAIQELDTLKGCTSVRTLQISEVTRTTDLERTHKGVFEAVIAWLSQCKQLTSVKFSKFLSGASILTQLFNNPRTQLQLTNLELLGFSQASASAFYDTLPTQAESLRDLLLQSETEDDPAKIDTLVQAICSLRRLVSLDLKNVSDFFRDEHFIVIASSLRQLEELWLSGWGITDQVFDALAGLHSLKRVELYAYSNFTCEGLLSYIETLGVGNKGLLLGVSMAAPHRAMTEPEQEIVRQRLQDKVDGRFDYTLARDPDMDDDDSEEDSD